MSVTDAAADESILLTSREQRALALRLTLSLAAAGALILSALLETVEPSQRDVAQLIAGIAAVLVGIPALQTAWRSLLRPDLHGLTDQLIALAFIAAWASGDLITATLLPLIMVVGQILEERSLLGSQEAIRALTSLAQNSARRLKADGEAEEINAANLIAGDIIEVRAGDRVPADGTVLSGTSSVDTASITGESVPIEVAPGDDVHNGSINLEGLLKIRVSNVGGETSLGRVIGLMQDAENIKPAVTKLLERYAGGYMALVLLLTACFWFLTGNTVGALALLVAACPCSLVLAAPATSIAAISVASRHGILVKGAAFLEQLSTVDAVVFDKTGTLTAGELALMGTLPLTDVSSAMMVLIAGSLGHASSHPVSRALGDEVREHDRLNVVDFKETRGLGIVGHLDGETVAFGRAALFETLGMALPVPPADHLGPIAGVAKGGTFLGWLLLADHIRPEALGALTELRRLGIEQQVMVTGDRRAVAEKVAAELNITEIRAEALPHEKMDFVLEEAAKGFRTMVVGDGINDALALKVAAVGVAMGARGTDVALASADLVLMTNDLRRLGTCVRLARHSRRTIMINVGIGLAWTAVVIGIAAAGVFGENGALAAAVLQNVGTVAVMANAGRLLKFQDRDPADEAPILMPSNALA